MAIRLKLSSGNAWTKNDVDPKYRSDHYSPGQLNTAGRCPRQYYFRYRCGLKIPPSGAMILGSGVHVAIEESLILKVTKGKLLPAIDAEEIAFESTKKRLKSGPVIIKDSDTPALITDDATVMARRWTVNIGPKRKPLTKTQRKKMSNALAVPGKKDLQGDRGMPKDWTGVEAFMKIRLPGVDQEVVGWMDFMENGGKGSVIIRDTKTGAQKKNDDDTRGPQLSTYAIACKMAGIEVAAVGLDVLVRPKSKTPDGVSQIIQVPAPTPATMKATVQGFQWLSKLNQDGNFPPCYDRHCSWCGYRELCDSIGTSFAV